MAKRTGKGSGKAAPPVVLNGGDIDLPPEKLGRPTDYNDATAAVICERIAAGKSLRSVCAADDMPAASTVFLWLKNHEDFSEQYAQSVVERSQAFREDILDIADDGRNDWMTINGHPATNKEAIERSKLRVDTRKWLMSKMMPRQYGEKVDLTTNGKDLPGPIMRLDDVEKA